ncbi:hypothetical protein E4U57_004608 [Claviceps arundinis]|uniref:Uncharacterized protein n=1 Tax=Claviceps arundinis TaxID=1623583 RepID=A0A9P7SQV1_9HYPO|nr:hypothetical protein E4U57_004608 [Claviceps arundinis]KAG5974600.1 hypothetical protein E4U56_004409 [Claviceps arundinis]
MQTVPSLVGTSTAIAAAASGLVFGQSINPSDTFDHEIPIRTRAKGRGHKRAISVDEALSTPLSSLSRLSILPSRRPVTSCAAAATASGGCELHAVAGPGRRQSSRPPISLRQRPQPLQVTASNTSSRYPSLGGDGWSLIPHSSIQEEPKESTASTNSWFRRLSLRPLSQQESSRSSTLADSTSFTLSHGSGASILPGSISTSKPPAPNKLVKRSISKQKRAEEGPDRNSKGQLPILRRPATSHQRSATLQQFRADIDVACSTPHPKYSFDEPLRPEELLGASPIQGVDQSLRNRRAATRFGWTSFFHTKTSEIEPKAKTHRRIGSQGDAASRGKGNVPKRINPAPSLSHSAGAYLVKPRMVSPPSTVSGSFVSRHAAEGIGGGGRRPKDGMDFPPHFEAAAEADPAASTRSRRSFSCSFSHTPNWPSSRRTSTSTSLRRSNQTATPQDCGSDQQRYVSAAPLAAGGARSAVGRGPLENGLTDVKSPPTLVSHHHHHHHQQQQQHIGLALALDSTAAVPRPARRRNASSPPAPPSNLPGLYADSSRLAASPAIGRGASYSMRSNHQPSGSTSSSSAGAAVLQRRGSHYEKFLALDGLRGDARDLNSGDEYDTDHRSDAIFDSVYTTGSGRVRAVETPLESLYDDSPPRTGGIKKPKRSSIQELLDHTWNENSKIMEEDEMSATPSRAARTHQHRRELKDDARLGSELSAPSHPRRDAQIDGGRSCLNEDSDEDWTRDENDALFTTWLSPSNGNSLRSKNGSINPNVRLALASIEGNSLTGSRPGILVRGESSLSSLFDWSEPSAHDKLNSHGGALRPQTAYDKEHGDPRGGRSVVRKGPVPMHVRSQSVPIVNERVEDAKIPGSKYSTWGLGAKGVSEDWDEDFDFAGDNNGQGDKENHDVFAVPESIRASQPSVRAHSGQIREFSLLVNDLKRLCRHGRELNMLDGDQKTLWKEAEGIIALASPDEDQTHLQDDDEDDDDDHSGSSVYMDAFELSNSLPAEEKRIEMPAGILKSAVLERNEPVMSKTAVVRERPSPRRRSVFSSEDDVFGPNWPLTDERPRSNRTSRPRTPENLTTKPQLDVNVVVRSVVETMQNRYLTPTTETSSARDPQKSYNATNRMHFDTNSLKALVRRAGELRDILADMIRQADQLTQSPVCTPRHERNIDSSPAFTRVFDDPGSSPARRSVRTRDTFEYSPGSASPSNMGRRVPLMTVN